MALQQVRVRINGVWTVLAYDAATGRYEGDLTAPYVTSANLPGGYYSVEVEATGSEGAVTTLDGTVYKPLRQVVREITAPVLTLVSPPAGYINTQTPTVVLTASDEAGGSGVDPDSFAVSVDGAAQTEGLSAETAESGIILTWAAAEALEEGPHTVSASISDRDGNVSTVNLVYTVDVTPPGLVLTLPDSHRVVDSPGITVAGRIWDGISGPPSVVIAVNGEEKWSFSPEGPSTAPVEFSAEIPLAIAANDFTVTATDGAGLVTVEQFRVIRLVTDRTEEDAEKLRDLFARGLNDWTAEETDWFTSTLCRRGGYDSLDVNRVELAADFVGGWLHEQGHFASWDPPVYWDPDGAFQASNAGRYLGRVESIREALAVPEGTPEAPKDMETALTLDGANGIEAILVAVDALRPLLERSPWGSGEIYCGEA